SRWRTTTSFVFSFLSRNHSPTSSSISSRAERVSAVYCSDFETRRDENIGAPNRGRLQVKVLDFPLWLRAAHFFNFLFLSFLVRSGIEILSAHPRLYWNDHC